MLVALSLYFHLSFHDLMTKLYLGTINLASNLFLEWFYNFIYDHLQRQFKDLCDKKGIDMQVTIPRITQQIGVAKRRNKMLLNMARSMMTQANLPFIIG